jgi:hypothetical protein
VNQTSHTAEGATFIVYIALPDGNVSRIRFNHDDRYIGQGACNRGTGPNFSTRETRVS